MAGRKIQISSRNESTKEARIPEMHISKLDDMLNQFFENITSVNTKFSITKQLENDENEVAAKDIYRSQVVFLESAFDYYMHSLGIYAMEQMYKGNWEKTNGYKDLKIPIDQVMFAIAHPEDTEWIDKAIISHHSSKTYMSSSEIKGQLTLVLRQGIFRKIADKMYYDRSSITKTEVKLETTLNEIFKRRNQIAHQADRNHISGELYEIKKEDVASYIEVIRNFVLTLHDILIE